MRALYLALFGVSAGLHYVYATVWSGILFGLVWLLACVFDVFQMTSR